MSASSVQRAAGLDHLDDDCDAFAPSVRCLDADACCAGGLRPWTSWTGERFMVCGVHAAERRLFAAARLDCLRALPDATARKDVAS